MKNKIYLILNNIRSAYNVGSIFRTADAVGVAKIYLCGITPIPYDQKHEAKIMNHGAGDKISKTALGAEKTVAWEYHKQVWRCLLEIKNQKSPSEADWPRAEKIKIIGLEQAKSSKNIFELGALDISPLALVVGNEVRGLSPQILKYCDEVVHIPMYGKKESLNVAVATGIALYEITNKNS